jgi:hypothetical protein
MSKKNAKYFGCFTDTFCSFTERYLKNYLVIPGNTFSLVENYQLCPEHLTPKLKSNKGLLIK